jgi:hypothetical protein
LQALGALVKQGFHNKADLVQMTWSALPWELGAKNGKLLTSAAWLDR